MTMPAIAPLDRFELELELDEEVALLVLLVLLLVGEDVVEGVVNRERSLFWKAIVIGCAHMRCSPEMLVKSEVVPSRLEVKPLLPSTNIVVAPASAG